MKPGVVKVTKCAEFRCPFFHAGIMGSVTCEAAKRDISETKDDKPPEWCPLRVGAIKVQLK